VGVTFAAVGRRLQETLMVELDALAGHKWVGPGNLTPSVPLAAGGEGRCEEVWRRDWGSGGAQRGVLGLPPPGPSP